MTLRLPRSRRRPPAGAVRAGVLAAIALVAVACSGGDGTAGGEPVPTLLTAPIQSTSTTSTTISTTTSSAGASTTRPSTTGAASTTAVATTTSEVGTPSGPGATPASTSTSSTIGSTVSSSSSVAGATPTAVATSTTADIEPAPPTVASTVPIPTAPEPPDTTGGREADYLLAPRAIAGLQFGASRTTVLNRMRTLLGDPLIVSELPDCPDGPATALQWFNVGLIITDRGLAYYKVAMNLDYYGDYPVPGWHTVTGLKVGDGRAQLDALYPAQVAYGTPSGLATPFSVTAGADAGIAGQLDGDVVGSISVGTDTC